MLAYFCIYSFIGYLMESTYISIFKKKWISSGLLDGPYIPLYGIGATILIYTSPHYKHSYILTFIIGSLLMTILEYITAVYIEYFFQKKCWDYHHHPLNFKGRICLQYSLIWGLLAILLIYYIHPLLSFKQNIFSEILSLIIICFIIKDTINKKRIVSSS